MGGRYSYLRGPDGPLDVESFIARVDGVTDRQQVEVFPPEPRHLCHHTIQNASISSTVLLFREAKLGNLVPLGARRID